MSKDPNLAVIAVISLLRRAAAPGAARSTSGYCALDLGLLRCALGAARSALRAPPR